MADLARKVKRRIRSLSTGRTHRNSDEFFSDSPKHSRRNKSSESITHSGEDSNQSAEEIYNPFEEWEFDDDIDMEDISNESSENEMEKTPTKKQRKPKTKRNLINEVETMREMLGASSREMKNLKAEMKKIRLENDDLTPLGGVTSDILPPPLLDKSESDSEKENLRRSATYERWFKVVPVFTADGNIRDFLHRMNSVIYDTGLQISKKSFRAILLNKLDFEVRSEITGGEVNVDKTVEQIYRSLQSHYDFSEPADMALVKLFQLQKGELIDSLDKFRREATRLLALTNSTAAEKSKHFGVAIANVLPKRIWEFFESFIKRYKRRHDNNYPEINEMIQFLRPYRDEIDQGFKESIKYNRRAKIQEVSMEQLNEQISRNVKKQEEQMEKLDNKISEVSQREQRDSNRPGHKRYCEYCKTTGHTEPYCFKKKNANRDKICGKCGRSGHTTESCRSRCRMCFSVEHTAELCDVYPGILITQDKCSICFAAYKIRLYHPESKCVAATAMASKN